jgi:hypothetical protein
LYDAQYYRDHREYKNMEMKRRYHAKAS